MVRPVGDPGLPDMGWIEQAAPRHPLVTAGREGRGVEVGVAVPGPLEQEVGIVGEAPAADRRRAARARSLRPPGRRHGQVEPGAQVDLGGIPLGEALLHPGGMVGPGVGAPAAGGLPHEPGQGRLVAVVERPPPADRRVVEGRDVRAVVRRGERGPDDPRVAGLARVAPGPQGQQTEDEIQAARVLPAPGPPAQRR